ncbi:AfaD family invasin [Yersinia sp. 2545 StPb PI]|uniref:AfaD family invasin n=1 Tax=unclassified Yersinia (in: enterobacteria) TaxID=2653513 RepID=UPI003FA4D488
MPLSRIFYGVPRQMKEAMMAIKYASWRGCVMVVLWAGLSLAQAADTVQLTLRMDSVQVAGRVLDNSRIGQGQIVYDGEHAGFQVWSDTAPTGGQPNSYVLTGQSHGNNQLRVRIEQEGWVADSDGGKGIKIQTGERSTGFDLVIDGDQTVLADRYTLTLRGVGLQP